MGSYGRRNTPNSHCVSDTILTLLNTDTKSIVSWRYTSVFQMMHQTSRFKLQSRGSRKLIVETSGFSN
jgi:hypothetical protein